MLRWHLDGSNVEGSQQALCHLYQALMGLSHWVDIPSEEIGQLMQEYKLFMETGETTTYLLLFARSYFVFGLKYQLRRAHLTAK